MEKNQAISVGFFSDLDGQLATMFKEVAEEMSDVIFYISSNEDVWNEYDEKDGSVIVLKTFDEKKAQFSIDFTKSNLEDFITKSTTPLVYEYSPENESQIFETPDTKHFLLFSSKNDKEYEARIEIVSVSLSNYKRNCILSLTLQLQVVLGVDDHCKLILIGQELLSCISCSIR